MLKSIIISACALTLAGGAVYYTFNPTLVLKRITQKSLDKLEESVATQDQGKIKATLGEMLDDTSHIKLAVSFLTIPGQNTPVVTQEFDKQSFLTFIDNTTYTLQNYSFKAQVQQIQLAGAPNKASITFDSEQTGEGTSYYAGGGFAMRFNATTQCAATIHTSGNQAIVDNMECQLKLASVPKAPKNN